MSEERDLKIALRNELEQVKEELKELQDLKTTEYEYIEFARMSKDKFNDMEKKIREKENEIKELQEINDEPLNQIAELKRNLYNLTRKYTQLGEVREMLRENLHHLRERCFFTDYKNKNDLDRIKNLEYDDWILKKNIIDERKFQINELSRIVEKQRKEKLILDNYIYLQKDFTYEDIGIKNNIYTRNTLKGYVEKYASYTPSIRENRRMLTEVLQRYLLTPVIILLQRRFKFKKSLPMRFIYDSQTLKNKLLKTFTENCIIDIVHYEHIVIDDNDEERDLLREPYNDDDDARRFTMIHSLVLSKDNRRYFAGSILKREEDLKLARNKFTSKDFAVVFDRLPLVSFLDTHTQMGMNRYAFNDPSLSSGFLIVEN